MARKKADTGNKMRDALVTKLTQRLVEITYPAAVTGKKLTPQQERDLEIVKAAHDIGGCATSNLVQLLEAVLERPLPRIPESSEDSIFPVGTVIVITGNPNGHSYEVGKTVLIAADCHGVMDDGNVGNCLPVSSKDEFAKGGRLATKEEIAAFVPQLVNAVTTPLAGGFIWKGDFVRYAPDFLKEIGL